MRFLKLRFTIFLLLFTIFLLVLAGLFINDLSLSIDEFLYNLRSPFQMVSENDVKNPNIEFYEKDDVVIAISRSSDLKIFYDTNKPSPLGQVSTENNFLAGINGGFFQPDNTHAGLLIINGEVIVNNAPVDKQLTHNLIYDASTRTMSFESTQNFDQNRFRNNSNILAFQSGPLFIDNGQITNGLIDSSLNGNGSYLRSFIGKTTDEEIFIGISKTSVDLKRLASTLLSIDVLKDKGISVLNLDGGTSTSFYAIDSKYSFRDFKALPIVLGLKSR